MQSAFFRQLSALLDAGVPVYQALTAIQSQSQPRRERNFTASLSASVLEGNLLSQAMAACPHGFTRFDTAMVVAGERSGNLALALKRLAECLEEQQAMRSAIKQELFSPKLTMTLVLLFWPFVLFSYREHPVAEVFVGVLPLLSFCVLLLLGAMLPRLSGQSSPGLDRVISKIPVLGKTASLIAQTQFTRTLSYLYSAGISLPEAVRWSYEASGNACLAEALRTDTARLDKGEQLAAVLSVAGVLDPLLITMLKTGELTGNFEVVLDKAAEHFQQTTDLTLHRLKVALGVTALLNVGFCVAIIAIGFYTR